MKKTLIMILAAVLLLSLCACTAEPQATEPTENLCIVGHSWSDANCRFPKTCTVCYATEGQANGHNWEKGKCTVCGTLDPNDDFLTTGTWMYITKQGWKVIDFLPDGTCEIRTIIGMPKSAVTAEECAANAMAELQRYQKDRWEELAKSRYHIFKILDYYYCCEMTRLAVEYTVEDSMIILEQEGFLPVRLLIAGRGKLVDDLNDQSYVNLPCEYVATLFNQYNENN